MHYSDRLCIVSCIFSEYSEYSARESDKLHHSCIVKVTKGYKCLQSCHYSLSLPHRHLYAHHGHIDIDIDYILYISYKHKLYLNYQYEHCSYSYPLIRAYHNQRI